MTVPFNAATLDGPESRDIRLRVTDNDGREKGETTTVTIENVPPTVTVTVPIVSVDDGQTATNDGTW